MMFFRLQKYDDDNNGSDLSLKAAEGEVEVDWEESVWHHICSMD